MHVSSLLGSLLSLLLLSLLLIGAVSSHASEPDEGQAEAGPPREAGDVVVGEDTIDPEPSAREQQTITAPDGPSVITIDPGTATILDGLELSATVETAFAAENDLIAPPAAAAPAMDPSRALTDALLPDPPRVAAPEPRAATDPLAPLDTPRAPRRLVSRKAFVDAAATTVMLATTIVDRRHGSLQPLRGQNGDITGWRIRAVSAKRFFGVCDDDDFAHVYDDRTVGMCTGFFVTADLVLTAGHCIDAIRNHRHLRVVLDYAARPGSAAPRELRPEQVLAVELEERGQSPGQDWALLRVVDAPAEDRIAPLCRPSDDCSGAEGIFAVSHPLGMPQRFLTNANVLETSADRIVTDLDTFVGSSGSPVFDRKTGRVLGMVISGRADFRRARKGCMRTAVVHRDAAQRRGEIAMPIDRLPASVGLRILPWQSLRNRATGPAR